MHTLLFVDDQREILNALRRTLMQRMDDWDIHVAISGEEALKMIDAISFDVVVTDIKMPHMNGADLLEQVAEKHPSSIRFVLSGYTERDLVYRTIGNVHQFLSKPIDTDQLIISVQKALELKNRSLPESVQKIVNGLRSLPSMPAIYIELMDALDTSNVSLTEVSDIVQQDIALTTRVMQLVNSSFFGSPVYVSGPAHAVSLLGTEIMKGLVISSYAFSVFQENKAKLFLLDAFERHCFQVGELAKRIAEEETNNQLIIDDAFIAGLVHDIGLLILASMMPEEYDRLLSYAVDQQIPILEVENQELRTTHAEIGAYLLGTWGFRMDIVEAVTYQHTPRKSSTKEFCPLTAVHIANQLLNCTREDGNCPLIQVDKVYIDELGLSDRLDYWKSLSLQILDLDKSHGNTDIIC